MILKFPLDSVNLEREVMIHLYMPDNYMQHEGTYPVLYMFDGHNLFYDEDATYGRSWRLADHLEEMNLDLMVVGLECNHEGNERLKEYAPVDFYDSHFGGSMEGKGPLTLSFMIDELMPYLQLHFPISTDRNEVYIAGSSCGGLMALYCAYTAPEVFSKALCLSPFLIPNISGIKAQLGFSEINQDSSIYISWGAQEGYGDHEFILETRFISEICNILADKGVYFQTNVKVYGRHCEADWDKETSDFLEFLQK